MDAEHPRLVHLTAIVVGASDPGLALPHLWNNHGGADHSRSLFEMPVD
jgi:hypothetical protein